QAKTLAKPRVVGLHVVKRPLQKIGLRVARETPSSEYHPERVEVALDDHRIVALVRVRGGIPAEQGILTRTERTSECIQVRLHVRALVCAREEECPSLQVRAR